MPVLVDTGVLLAWVNKRDSRHDLAASLLLDAFSGRLGESLAPDWMLGEGLTFLRKKVRDPSVAERYAGLFHGLRDTAEAPLRMLYTGADLIEQAEDVFFRYFDRKLSFPDCVLLAHARRLGATVATFDAGFDGLVPVIGR